MVSNLLLFPKRRVLGFELHLVSLIHCAAKNDIHQTDTNWTLVSDLIFYNALSADVKGCLIKAFKS